MGLEASGVSGRVNAADAVLGRPLALGLADQPAVLIGQRSVSYGQLNAMANRNGNALRAAGVRRGDRVLFLMDDSPELIAAYLGAIRIGAVSVALNLRLAPRDLLYILQDSAAGALYVGAQFFKLYEEIAGQLEQPPRLVTLGCPPGCVGVALEDFLAGQSDDLESVLMAPHDIAYWMYSSGTTGRPKAIMHGHKSLLVADLLVREYFNLRPGERVMITSKMFFGFALGHSVMGGLQCGATVIVFSGWPEAPVIAEVVDQHRPQVFFSTPVMYRNLLREGVCASEGFQAVRHFSSAGEKLPETLFEQWRQASGKPICDGLGSSETMYMFLATHPSDPQPGSCGRRAPWAEVKLLDEAGQEIVTPGTPGEVAIRMSAQFCGYWNQPELTARVLRDGWYRPGDAFRFDEQGRWYHLGRVDDMLKISGQLVSPGEIEAAASALPGVAEAAAVGFPDADGLVRLALFAVAKDRAADREALAQTVLASLKASLAIYKCPRTIRFVDDLPRTATGKVQKFLLREMLLQTG